MSNKQKKPKKSVPYIVDGPLWFDQPNFFASGGKLQDPEKPVYNVSPDKFETKLDPKREIEFQKWLDNNHKSGNIGKGDYNFYKENGYGYDYDFRAAFDKGLIPDPVTKHWGDYGKKPNHTSFSNESMYHDVNKYPGGSWNGDQFVNPNLNNYITPITPKQYALGGPFNKDGKLVKQPLPREGNEELGQKVVGQGMMSPHLGILKGAKLPIEYDREYFINESGEKFIRNEFGNFNVSNDDANNRLNYHDYINNQRFIESHGMDNEEFYNRYPTESDYLNDYPQNTSQEYAKGGRLKYGNGGLWNIGTLNQGEQLGNSGLTGGSAAAIGQIANIAGTIGSGIVDNAIPDQDKRINVSKQTTMGAFQGAGQGAAMGANPLLVGLTGGLSIPLGALAGGAIGGITSHNSAQKAAKENHDALIKQNYGIESFDLGGNMSNQPQVNNQFGNQMSVFEGAKHTEGGIKIGQNNEVEAGEVKWKDYIFSDQLTLEGTKQTFASKAKSIKNKFKGRENDKKANEVLESELSALAAKNDIAKQKLEDEHNKTLDSHQDSVVYAKGGIFINPDKQKEFMLAAKKQKLSTEEFAHKVLAYGGRLNQYGNGGPFENKDNTIGNTDFNTLGNYSMLGSDNLPNSLSQQPPMDYSASFDFDNSGNMLNTVGTQKFGNYDPNVYDEFGKVKPKAQSANNTYSLNRNKPTLFDPNTEPIPNYNFDDMSNIQSKDSGFNGMKTSDQLPHSQLPSDNSAAYNKFLEEELLKSNSRNKFGYQEAGLLASNLAGVDNLIKSMKPAQTHFDRIKLDRLDLSEARLLNARNSALGQRITQENVRNNATSSGQALSSLAASNSALTNSRINADLGTYLQEKQTNTQIGNQEKQINRQIGQQEYIGNQQNKANAQSIGNASLASIGNNFQGYARDKQLSYADALKNKRMMEVINQIAPNYKWNVDPESDQMMLKYISKLSNQ